MIIDGILTGVMFLFTGLAIGSCVGGDNHCMLIYWGIVIVSFIIGIINMSIMDSKEND